MSYTKGPWFIELDQHRDTAYVTSDSRDGFIPICNIGIGFQVEIEIEQEDNAKLIAAAPELLEALEIFFDKEMGITHGDRRDDLDPVYFARKAIAKAKGIDK